jgi:hypothetical protein
MTWLRSYFHEYRKRRHLRPWALVAPILVLIVCLPLLRPLRHPDSISDHEKSRLATIQALAEHGTLEITQSPFMPFAGTARISEPRRGYVDEHRFSHQPPVMSALLAGPYWIIMKLGLTMDENPVLVPYLLTLLGVTLPVAGAAGMLYRMGRLFELPRKWRMALAVSVIFGSGLVSYAVVLNPHAPAAVLVLCAIACLIHISQVKNPARNGGWLAIAGLCSALAAVIDPGAVLPAMLILLVIPAMRWSASLKIGGVLLYLIGMTPALLLHAVLTVPLTGDILPPAFHPEMLANSSSVPHDARTVHWSEWLTGPMMDSTPAAILVPEDDFPEPSTWVGIILRNINRVLGALLGVHGLLSHFPVLVLGALGIAAVMHRHWPATTKLLAIITAISAATLVILYSLSRPNWRDAMFAARWFILFLPLLLFWAGAWLRRPHHPAVWVTAGCLLLFSCAVSLIGATSPYPPEGFNRYTAADALMRLVSNEKSKTEPLLAAGS